jgi:hypothetical protein
MKEKKTFKEKITDTQPVRVARKVMESINEMGTQEFLVSAGVDLTRAHERPKKIREEQE